jgi:aerobic-type carbon monoxide dehydrogenase small subunit (CoxS/CutS family)
VVVDNEAVRSCTTPIGDVQGKKVLTIEGLAGNERLHPIQQAFVDHDAFQCGFCTPGLIMGAYAFLLQNPKATRADIARTLESHLCRCGTHGRVLRAVESAAVQMKGGAR